MTLGDRQYFERRLAEESAAAGSTACPHARDVHLQLAELYSDRLRLIEALAAQTASEPSLDAPLRAGAPLPVGRTRFR